MDSYFSKMEATMWGPLQTGLLMAKEDSFSAEEVTMKVK